MSKADVTREAVERAARLYRSSEAAGAALGISGSAFGRICRRWSIPTPAQRLHAGKRASATSRQEGEE